MATQPAGTVRKGGESVIDIDAPDRETQVSARAAWLYYMEGQTQEQIARHLGINRIRVNRMLAAARESGMVQVRINTPLASCIELEVALAAEFGLRQAVVIPSPLDAGNLRRMVGLEGGRLLSERLGENMTVAVGWGRTLRHSLQAIQRRPVPGLEVVSLTGGLTRGSVMNSYETALRLADLFGAACSYIAGPALADTEETRDMLLRQAMLVDAFKHARKADIAYLSVGGLNPQITMAQLGLVDADDVAALKRAGAVGDLLGYWIDKDGQIVDHPLNRRVVALPPDDLKKIGEVIVISGGAERIPPIRAAIRKGVVHTLVTDEMTAAELTGRPYKGATA